MVDGILAEILREERQLTKAVMELQARLNRLESLIERQAEAVARGSYHEQRLSMGQKSE
jgi:hypothetical protein